MELKCCVRALPAISLLLWHGAWAQESEDKSQPDKVVIKAKRWLFNRETRYAHSLPEVNGATITVTKKTSVVELDAQPSVIDNNQREIFDRLPGIVLAAGLWLCLKDRPRAAAETAPRKAA